MSRSPCKRMARRANRKLTRERDDYIPAPTACVEGEYWRDADGNDLPPGNTYEPSAGKFGKADGDWMN